MSAEQPSKEPSKGWKENVKRRHVVRAERPLESQRAGMEMYLNALTNRIYGDKEKMEFSSGVLPLLLLGMFSGGFGSSAPLPPAMPKEAVGKEERPAD